MVKIFTMVKDEVDLVCEWIQYHGTLFGFSNIFVIDNYSTDGTYEKIQHEFGDKIHIERKLHFPRKGEYLTRLLYEYCAPGEIAFPIDIDEFIVLFDSSRKTISIDPCVIRNYLKELAPHPVYKMNYIQAKLPSSGGVKHIRECQRGYYNDCGKTAKIFVHSDRFKKRRLRLDQGFHLSIGDDIFSSLCLVHYHHRNLEQVTKKILNNLRGYGYPENDLDSLQALPKNCMGRHQVRNRIHMLQNRYTLPVFEEDATDISLNPLSTFFSND